MDTITTEGQQVNGLDVDALGAVMHEIERDPAKGQVEFRVRSEWMGQTRSRASVESYSIGGQRVHRHFTIDADEPFELLGRNTAPNPQELLMTALNACITVGYVAGASMKGIELEKVRDRDIGPPRPARVPRHRPGGGARLRHDPLRGADQGHGHAGAVPGDPRDGREDVTQLLQHLAARHDRRPAGGGVNPTDTHKERPT